MKSSTLVTWSVVLLTLWVFGMYIDSRRSTTPALAPTPTPSPTEGKVIVTKADFQQPWRTTPMKQRV
jgi:hypothetical protein